MDVRMGRSFQIITIIAIILVNACSDKPLDAPTPPPQITATPMDWSSYQAQRIQQKTNYIATHKIDYDWFSDFSFSETDGAPYIALRLLPVIAPELWGSQDNFLDIVGLFNDPRQNGYPMPRGIGLSVFARKQALADIDYASFTCAACHIGRVKNDTGKFVYLDGGINSEFNIVAYRVKLYKTLQKIIGKEIDPAKQQQRVVDAFLAALKKSHQLDPNFFYKNYKTPWVDLNSDYESAQIELFKSRASKVLAAFTIKSIEDYTGFAALLDKNYHGFQSTALKGLPGMADATGIFTVNSYNAAMKGMLSRFFASFIFPNRPGITDFMAVWEQNTRKAQWDSSHQTLVNGGGQWNGNIPIPMYRNLAAQSTLGLDNLDIRVSAFAVNLLDELPASVYPFNVDVTLAKKGEDLFRKNCAQCHQPHNGKVYDNLNVNLDRSYVVNWLIRRGGIGAFYDLCNPMTTVTMKGGNYKPCASFDGQSLEGKKDVIISPNDQHHGYNAGPLKGIWAEAPYLHNGSVPTLYHLLLPSERPSVFYKSRLEYDKKLVGFAWSEQGAEDKGETAGYQFDTNSFPSLSNQGHDTDIVESGTTYKLNWSDDKTGAMAIIEYLKTL